MSLNSIEAIVRSFVFQHPDVTHMPDLRRATMLFSQGQAATSIFYIQSGLVKLTRTNLQGGRIILAIRGATDLVGEEALGLGSPVMDSEAEVIQSATVFRIPTGVLQSQIAGHAEYAGAFLGYLVDCRSELAKKVELLCLHDVEFRILYYLGQLAKTVSRAGDASGIFQVPITQLELADLIGATRETTSTVLNQLERRGLVQLSRRMLTISSLEAVQAALEGIREQHSPMPNENNVSMHHA